VIQMLDPGSQYGLMVSEILLWVDGCLMQDLCCIDSRLYFKIDCKSICTALSTYFSDVLVASGGIGYTD